MMMMMGGVFRISLCRLNKRDRKRESKANRQEGRGGEGVCAALILIRCRWWCLCSSVVQRERMRESLTACLEE